MKKVLLLAVLAIVLVAMPAFASVQNVKVSGDINSTFVSRARFDLGAPLETERFDQKFFMTQTKLRVDADLTDKVSTTVGLINERAWDAEYRADASAQNRGDTEIDLNLAYVTIKEMLYSPLTVVVGRQAFAYGNSFVVDSMGPNRSIGAATGGLERVAEDLTERKAMDAIRMILDYNPLTIDLVYAKVDSNNLLGTGAQKDDIDLLGTNLNYKLGDKMNTVVEGYFWAKVDNSSSANNAFKTDTVYVPGVRASANVIEGLNLGAEIAWQRGSYARGSEDNVKREAMAYQLIGNYALPLEQTKAYKPVLTTAFTYLSGDKNPIASNTTNYREKYTGWDPMFENQSRGKIFNTLFNYSNAYIATIKGAFNPIEDITAAVEWNGLWLDKKINNTPSSVTSNFALYQPDGTTLTGTRLNKDNKKLGDEIDLTLAYAYTEDVTIGAGLGWFKPGDLFQEPNRKIASQAMVNLDVKF